MVTLSCKNKTEILVVNISGFMATGKDKSFQIIT